MALPKLPSPALQLLRAVRRRHHLVRLARTGFFAFLACAALYATLLLVARLSGALPLAFTPATLAIPALAALALAVTVLGFARTTPPRVIARLVDQRLGCDDLFLTAQALDGSAGAYQALVLARATTRATGADAGQIQPFTPWRRGAVAMAIAGALAAGVLLLPQLDPFGHQAEHARLVQRQHQLELAQQAAKARVEALAQEHTDQPTSAAVAQQLAKLAATFDQLKADAGANRQQLSAEQRELGKALMQAKEQPQFAPDLEQGELQRLGAGDLAKGEALRQELAKGDSRAAQEHLDQLKDLAERLAATSDPAQQQQLRAELKQQLERMEEAVGKRGQAAQAGLAQQALNQALDQLAQSGNPGSTAKALGALKDSLELAKAELGAMAQGARDVTQLDEALKTLQMARQLNELGALGGTASDDGPAGKGPGKQSLEEYRKLYAKLMQQHGQGEGHGPPGSGGMGPNPGRGDGGKAHENEDAATQFDPQRSRSQLTAGQTLMQWKTNGPSDKGVAQEDYRRSVNEVRQGVSEALLHEQLPPGYQEAVKRYFDALDPTPDSGKK